MTISKLCWLPAYSEAGDCFPMLELVELLDSEYFVDLKLAAVAFVGLEALLQ